MEGMDLTSKKEEEVVAVERSGTARRSSAAPLGRTWGRLWWQ